MEIYFLLLCFVLFTLLFCEKNKNSFGLITIFFVLAFFSGFRYMVGIDYLSYSYLFDANDFGTLITNEPGFTYLVVLLKKVLPSKYYLFLFFASITSFFTYKAILKLSDDFKLSTIIYFCTVSFYLFSFNIVRQFTAATIFLFSLNYLVEGKKKTFVIICLLAAFFFHVSILFMIPLVFFYRLPVRKINLFIVVGLALIVGLNVKIFVKNAFVFSHYTTNIYEEEVGVGMHVILFALLSIIIELLRKRTESIKATVLKNVNLFGIGILIILLFQTDKQLVMVIKRVHNFCLLVYVILIPYMINNSNYDNKTKRLLNTCLVLFFIMIYSFYIVNLGEHIQIVPYDTYLSF